MVTETAAPSLAQHLLSDLPLGSPPDPIIRSLHMSSQFSSMCTSCTVISYLLSQHLPDANIMCMVSCASAQDQWELVTKEFQAKSKYMQANLHQSFLDMHCIRGGGCLGIPGKPQLQKGDASSCQHACHREGAQMHHPLQHPQ